MIALAAAVAAPALAQAFPRVHVTDLAQRADRASVAPGEVFHLTIHVKIAQQRERLDELILGSFDNCEIISNETVRRALPDGTDFVERLALEALAPGEATISPAYIDALDPTVGKPLRYSSNAVTVHVTGRAPFDAGYHAFAETARRVALAAAIGVGLVAAVFVLGVMFVRRRKRSPPPTAPRRVVAPAPVAAPNAGAPERLTQAADAYRMARSQATLADVRGVLFELAGVARGVTLVDALRALGERDRPLRVALFAAERATFGPAGERASAGDDVLAAIQAYGAGAPASEATWTR